MSATYMPIKTTSPTNFQNATGASGTTTLDHINRDFDPFLFEEVVIFEPLLQQAMEKEDSPDEMHESSDTDSDDSDLEHFTPTHQEPPQKTSEKEAQTHKITHESIMVSTTSHESLCSSALHDKKLGKKKFFTAARRRRKRISRATTDTSARDYRPKSSAHQKYARLASTAVKYDAKLLSTCAKGYWVGKPTKGKKNVQSMDNLIKGGFKVVEWDGKTPHVIVDQSQRIIAVLAGTPCSPDWNQVGDRAVQALREVRAEGMEQGLFDRKGKKPPRRGDFFALSRGVSIGTGQTVPANLGHSPQATSLLNRLSGHASIRRIVGFQSSTFSFYAPKLYKYYEKTLDILFNHNPDLERNFDHSIFPAITYNCGPRTVCKEHLDPGNVSHGLCAITALGDYNPATGGHIVLYPLKLMIEFPPGSTVLIPSASLAHGNTPIKSHETRYSITQYCAGGLFRWVRYEFRRVSDVLNLPDGQKLKEEYDGVGDSRWKWALSLFSKVNELVRDRQGAFSI